MKTIKEYLNEGLIKRQSGVDMRTKIETWLNEHKIKGYTINDDLTIDVKGDVGLRNYGEERLPEYIQFGKVTGSFRINICPKLVSLKGCPERVGKSFDCSYCRKLESLEGAPQIVERDFWGVGCEKLKSLEGAPRHVGGAFWCSDCSKLTSLEGAPEKIGSDFVCSRCTNLTSLQGAPEKIDGGFYCYSCGGQFTQEYVKNICKVKGHINV